MPQIVRCLSQFRMRRTKILATMGPADPSCGVLHRSPESKRAYDEGRLKPTLGLVIWPRDEMLAWARTRPDLEH